MRYLCQLLFLVVVLPIAQAEKVSEWHNWIVIEDEYANVVELEGGKLGSSLILPANHRAYLNTSKVSNFTLDVDIKAENMAGIGFRAQGQFDYDYLLFRAKRYSQERAIQYLPVFNGAIAWHLYAHHQAVADISSNEFFHLRLQCYNHSCRVFIDNELKFEFNTDTDSPQDGFLILRAAFGSVEFKNLQISKGSSFSFERKKNHTVGRLSQWEISPQIDLKPNSPVGEINYSFQEARIGNWRSVSSDEFNIVNISKLFENPNNAVFARTTLKAETDNRVILKFDYSHFLTIFLNGAIVFSGRELDTENFFRVIPGEEGISLALDKGENELVFLISGYDLSHNPKVLGRHQYQNWGFTASIGAIGE